MSYTEVSAREPIFYRWHGHLEDLMQEYRDTKLPKYPKHEFNLPDDVKVVGIKLKCATTAPRCKNLLNQLRQLKR